MYITAVQQENVAGRLLCSESLVQCFSAFFISLTAITKNIYSYHQVTKNINNMQFVLFLFNLINNFCFYCLLNKFKQL